MSKLLIYGSLWSVMIKMIRGDEIVPEVHYTLKRGTPLTDEEIAVLDAAKSLSGEYDEDNEEIDPVNTPEQYAALMKAVSERNQRVARKQKELA
ncbi:MAG: hypothetical protein IJ733_01115 [Lachnospiraceae bacterium]|nr:hypothetical protein [Lachnospiraceae bacterium]